MEKSKKLCPNFFYNKIYRKIALKHDAKKYKDAKLQARITEDPNGMVLSEVKATIGVDVNPLTGVGAGFKIKPSFKPRGQTAAFTKMIAFGSGSWEVPIESFGHVYVSVYVVNETPNNCETRLIYWEKVCNHTELLITNQNIREDFDCPIPGKEDLPSDFKIKFTAGTHGMLKYGSKLLRLLQRGEGDDESGSESDDTGEDGSNSDDSADEDETDEAAAFSLPLGDLNFSKILPELKRRAIDEAKKQLEKSAIKRGISLDAIELSLQEASSIEDVVKFIGKPELFFQSHAAQSILFRVIIFKMKPQLEPMLKKRGLDWADVHPVLAEIDSMEELREAAANPEAFFSKLMASSAPVMKKLVVLQLKPQLEPMLEKRGLDWADVHPVLAEIDSVEELREAAADPGAFFSNLMASSVPVVKKLMVLLYINMPVYH
jgi:hypothetical protein